jgi:hypothetical protein
MDADQAADTNGVRAEGIECGDYTVNIAGGVEAGDDDDASGTDDEFEYIDIGDGISDTALLVDEYIVSIPQDPSQAVTYANVGAGGGTDDLIDSGYSMCVTSGGRVTVAATPERATSITVSR